MMFSQLFTPDAVYHWTPFQEPQRGRQEIASAVGAAFSGQRDIQFSARLLAAECDPCIAHWTCSFTRVASGRRVAVDGLFLLRFDDSGLCREFREWWHSSELVSGV
jgi:hypothetical protein